MCAQRPQRGKDAVGTAGIAAGGDFVRRRAENAQTLDVRAVERQGAVVVFEQHKALFRRLLGQADVRLAEHGLVRLVRIDERPLEQSQTEFGLQDAQDGLVQLFGRYQPFLHRFVQAIVAVGQVDVQAVV